MVYIFLIRCFLICSNWPMFHSQLTLLKEILKKNGYPENFIDRCFKLLLNIIHISRENTLADEKKPLQVVILIQELYYYKLGHNHKSPSKGYLTVVNYRLFLKVKINFLLISTLKTHYPNSYISCGLQVSLWIMQ